jgi:DNA (cytosine-5)-methyltransferase 1
MLTPQHLLDLTDELGVDLFAGGGGLSTAYEQATGRHTDIALNHNDDAISMHRMNHPQTRHFIADVFEVDPRTAVRGRPVGFLHLSPDCTHHSQAAGGQPRDRKIRALSWVGFRWAGQVRPRVITLENVKQILKWGPLIAKRDKATGRVLKLDGTVAAKGEQVPVHMQYLVPDPARAGITWRRFVACLQGLGYAVEARVLNAADYGAATTRERLFMVARCDGQPIVWPEPTHHKKPAKGQKKWRPAADHIDFNLPCPSIFDRARPLADATCRRIAKGVQRYVLDSADPFIVQVTRTGDRARSVADPMSTITTARGGEHMLVAPSVVPATHQGSDRLHDVAGPLPTITAAHRGELMLSAPILAKFRFKSDGGRLDEPLPTITSGGASKRDAGAAHAMGIAAPVLVQTGYGEREGQDPRALDLQQPLGTVVAGGGKHAVAAAFVQPFGQNAAGYRPDEPAQTVMPGATRHSVVAAFLAQHNTMPGGGVHPGHDARQPLSTIIGSGSHQNVVAAHLAHLRGNCDARDLRDPLHTISAAGQHHGLVEYSLAPEHEAGALRVAAFLMRYYGEGGQWGDPRDPMATITTKDRLALVTVVIRGTPYVIVDIGLRMLTPPELYGCQGFPAAYIIDRGHDGRRFSKAAQVRMCGNSVSPPPAHALIAANYGPLQVERRRAA